jgi:hypothetical protein
MPATPALRRTPWQAVADQQAGVISRGQLLELGLTAAQVKADINSRRGCSTRDLVPLQADQPHCGCGTLQTCHALSTSSFQNRDGSIRSQD